VILMKVMTIIGTRPEIIRLSRIIPTLDKLCNHILVHTGQNYVPNLSDIFFRELGIRKPDYMLECLSSSQMEEVSTILLECERVIQRERPDRLLVLGDTNSALSAFVAKRMRIPVFHMEAGNRCYDDRVPEEVNRRVIDHCSDVLMPYTERSRDNLLREGIPSFRIHVIGNPIKEVLDYYAAFIEKSDILKTLDLHASNYFLVTLHRAENVDEENRLRKFLMALGSLSAEYNIPVVCSLHPRTRSQILKQSANFDVNGVRFIEPPGLFDFVCLEKHATCVLTDSGTVQEESCILGIPNVTLRDVTERPETIEVGSNMLSGAEPDSIQRCVRTTLNQNHDWLPPAEYLVPNVSRTVAKIVLGYQKERYIGNGA
jgi:UDP-N-acetylglucosamine 2-epimerase (non-hydrolysing)